jgi:tetratricopeptide (TPR) repeat protein
MTRSTALRIVQSALPVLTLLAVLCTLLPSCGRRGGIAAGGDSSAVDRGIACYNAYRLDEAKRFFTAAIEEEPDDALAISYLAATEKYLMRQTAESQSGKRPDYTHIRDLCLRALEADPCQTFAIALLADLYYPQFGMLENANYDSTAKYLERGLRCPDPDPELLLTRLNESWRLDRDDMERDACRRLLKSGFLTPTVLHYYRMVLGALPPDAVVFTSGDMDTYPLVALQKTEQLRPDITVANISMLNMYAYAARVCRRSGLPAALREADFQIFGTADDGMSWPCRRLIGAWLKDPAASGRPFIVLGTVSDDDRAPFAGAGWKPADYGIYAHFTPPRAAVVYDSTVYTAMLDNLRDDWYREPGISARDRSSIRQSGDRFMLQYALAAACLQRATALHAMRRDVDAQHLLGRVKAFRAAIPWPKESAARMDEFIGQTEKMLQR